MVLPSETTGNDIPAKFINRPEFSQFNLNYGKFQKQQVPEQAVEVSAEEQQ